MKSTPKSIIFALAAAVAALAVLLLVGCQQGGVKLYCSGGEKTIDNPIDNGGNGNLLITEIQFFTKFLPGQLIDKQA